MGLQLREDVRTIAIDHEFSKQAAALLERNECERVDALGAHGLLERFGQLGTLDIFEANRLCILEVPLPRRMAVDRAPVILGQRTPRDEPHHARLVEQQDGRAIAA